MKRDFFSTTFPGISRWRILGSRQVFKDRWLGVRADRCSTNEGHIVDPWYVVEAPDTVQMVILNDKYEVLLICQYRHGAQTISLEFPCGEVDEGEQPEEAFHRELREETGHAVREVQLAGRFFANPARQPTVVHTYVGFGAHLVAEVTQDPTEKVHHRFFSIAELEGLISDGTFTQGLHVGSWYLAKSMVVARALSPVP